MRIQLMIENFGMIMVSHLGNGSTSTIVGLCVPMFGTLFDL